MSKGGGWGVPDPVSRKNSYVTYLNEKTCNLSSCLQGFGQGLNKFTGPIYFRRQIISHADISSRITLASVKIYA